MADLAADAAAYAVHHRPGPPRKRTEESRRAFDREYSRRFRRAGRCKPRVLSAESRRRRNARMAGYLREWRRRTGRCVSDCVVRLRWARTPNDPVFHLMPTLGKLSRRPPTPTHPICAPHRRLTKVICPFRGQTPIGRCPDCIARRTAWERLVNAPMPEHESLPSRAATPMHRSAPPSRTSPMEAMADANPSMAEILKLVSFDTSGISIVRTDPPYGDPR